MFNRSTGLGLLLGGRVLEACVRRWIPWPALPKREGRWGWGGIVSHPCFLATKVDAFLTLITFRLEACGVSLITEEQSLRVVFFFQKLPGLRKQNMGNKRLKQIRISPL